jgi:UDP-3-O-[3-hydroxymyristoyl] N-acetylglucosamine deacetylase/3-hydroxyacyl-[acyl-carrier-protein] dehydratase
MPVTYQTTVDRESSVEGSSLHTGGKVTLTLRPAPADTGYIFRRIDLKDQPTLTAHVDLVNQVERSTTLSSGALKIHTVEHLLSALRGSDIDNAFIDMDSNEPPIGDGSAEIFIQLLAQTGKTTLTTPRTTFELREPLLVEGKDGAFIAAFPYDGFKISCTNANHTGFFTQYYSTEITPETYLPEISKARTFVFYEEVQPLLEKGLIKGGSLENAIVIRGDSILSKDPIRYPEEFARHKILDIVGDLALFPLRLKAHIVAAKTSHALNVEMAKAIAKSHRKYLSQLMPVENIPLGESALDVNQVMKILPHRYPFLMVDRVLKFEGENKAVGVKNITINEPFFQGHFPGLPVMPGVLQLEAMAQLASILFLRKTDDAGRIGFFMSADNIKFRKPVTPGDTLLIQVELVKSRGKIAKATGHCSVNGEVVSEGDMTFAIQ